LDPDKYFIVATDMFQNGLSSSPSNTPPPFNGPNFPLISIRDNLNAGYRLVTEIFKVEKIKAALNTEIYSKQFLILH
jgi:homoserine O-acetyltransferase/O-succinyltransferase